jgi:hypothetical protein
MGFDDENDTGDIGYWFEIGVGLYYLYTIMEKRWVI